jgi:hypothetical protein
MMHSNKQTYYIDTGDKFEKRNVYAKDVTAPITFDDNDDKNKPSNFGSAGNILTYLMFVLCLITWIMIQTKNHGGLKILPIVLLLWSEYIRL